MRVTTGSLALIVLCAITATAALPSWCDGITNKTECARHVISKLTQAEKISQLKNDAVAIDRLNISKWDWWGEALHGLQRQGYTTSFPQSIGLGATWDPELLREIGDQISTEDRLKRFNWEFMKGYPIKGLSVWSPNVNIVRDPRWGRGQETYGEDPYLTGTLAVQFIHGVQGPDAPEKIKTIATPKHFAVHSGPEIGRHSFNSKTSTYDFEDTYMPAFRAAITEGKAGSIMCSYNEINGVPACANDNLLGKKLREEWGFWGYVVSDCDAVVDEDAEKGHHNYTQTKAQAAALSIIAGTDLDCGDTYDSLGEALSKGLVTMDVLDKALERIFYARLRTHEDARPLAEMDDQVPDNRELALRAEHKAIVLLKNDGILPLKEGLKVAIVGPTADLLEDVEGNYHGTPVDPISALQAAYKYFGEENVTYAQGSLFVEDFSIVVPRSALRAPDGSPGLLGEYYTNKELQGKPALTRVDKTIDFDIDFTPPFDAPNPWDYSVRWTGSLNIMSSGKYMFELGNDAANRVLLYIDDQLMFNTTDWQPKVEITFRTEGRHSIILEYHHGGGQTFRLKWRPPAKAQLKEAAMVASQADVVIAFVGLTPTLESEENGLNLTGFLYGDRTTIELPATQQKLLDVLKRTGKPIVLILNSGSAVAINWATDNARAVMATWYGGEMGGTAIMDTLLGRNNPAGRLPITFYQSDRDLPEFTDYEMEGRTYRYFRGTPLYPFGHGLSYTSFNYSKFEVPATVQAGDELVVTVAVQNTGKMDGEEVVQVYLKPYDNATPKKINHRLVAFDRVHVDEGEISLVTLRVDPRQLSLVDSEGNRAVKEGEYTLYVGGGQPGYVPTLSASFKIQGNKPLSG